MGLFGSDESDDPRVQSLIDGARGHVTAEALTRTGSYTLRTGTFHDRPLVEYLRDGEQPHYVLASSAQEFEFGETDYGGDVGYWTALVVTDQRLFLLAGFDDGDRGEVIPYGVVDPDSVEWENEAGEQEFRFTAGGLDVEVENQRPNVDEIDPAAEYVADRAREAGGPDAEEIPEVDRPRGPVYEVPNFDIEATIWRPTE